jgi:Bacterial Ig-like domain (group 3)
LDRSAAGVLLCPALLTPNTVVAQSASVVAQPAKPLISLDPVDATSAANVMPMKGDASFTNAPANFRSFPSAHVGEDTYAERLTLRFAASTQIKKIESSNDFHIEESGSCAAERFYSAGDTCILLVRFAPQGPGRRFGKLTITHTASAEPLVIGLGGNGYAPVISFTPAMISTVASTYPSNVGLLSSAKNLAVDGGDTLYIADSGNKVIRYIDSSGNVKSLATTATNPLGVAVDNFGEVYFDEPSANTMHEVYDYGPVVQVNGTGTASCPAATPCNFSSEALGTPGTMSMDAYNHLFFVDSHMGAAIGTMQPLPAKLIFLYDPFTYQTNPSSAIVSDASDNIYSVWNNGGECEIVRGTLYDAENSNVIFTKIVGGHTCGFAGDGGQAGNAEVNAPIGQMTFDLAGNFYFTDTTNQRVRRVDAVTGLISTIAGNGVAGYTGDFGSALSAELSSPTGVAVDSQGQVYIISSTTATGTVQVVRKLMAKGYLLFNGQLKGTTSPAQTVTVSNTGNSSLVLTNVVITGTNATEFKIDPNTTSCLLTPGSTLYSGQSCKVGILFTPATGGSRTANLTFLDNTVTGSNTVQLFGVAALPAPTFAITSPATSTSVTAGTAVTFAVSVTSTTSPAPTGKVTMLLDGATISGSPATLNTSGVASLSVVTSVTGMHTLSATYSGDANYATAGPLTRTYTVTAASVVKLTSSANPAAKCKPVNFSITVAGTNGAVPTGRVELKKGSTALAVATLINGTARVSTSALPAGTNVLTASYGGDAKNVASTSAPFEQMIFSSGASCNIIQPLQPPSKRLPTPTAP